MTLSTACSCDGSGVCTAGVTGTSNYNGAASFDYTVTANAQVSNLVSASLTINAVDDNPIANALSPAAFNEDVESTITLSYSDTESHLANVCALSSLSGVTESTSCSCDGSGVCTVGVTGTLDNNGAASFEYTVTANGLVSATALASLTLLAVNDVPVLSVNTGFSSGIGATETISTTILSSSDVDDLGSNIIYEIETDATRGAVKLSGSEINAGATFTQDDLVNNLVTYVHTAGDSVDDSFTVSIHDDDNAYALGATVGTPATISIAVSSCTPGSITYTADGTFDVDNDAGGCSSIVIKAWGGGGGGGFLGGSIPGSGGGAGYAEKSMTVSAGEIYTVSIGLGGQAGDCGAAAGSGGFSGGAGGAFTVNGSDGVGDGADTGGAAGLGITGTDGGAGGYGGGGGGGGGEDGMFGAAGGGASTFYDGATKLVVAGGGGGGGAGEAGDGGDGGAACGIAGSDAVNNGDALGGAGGGGGDCFATTTTSGSGSLEGNSANSGGAGAGGDSSGSCPASNGVDGKLIVEFN